MAFPPVPANLSDQESVQAIIEAEAGILDCMAAFFCGPGGAVELIKAGADLATKIELFTTILPAYANKENSIANVMTGAAKKLAADKNLDPCALTNC